MITTIAHGETETFSSTILSENRRVVLSGLSGPAAPLPQPQPQPQPALPKLKFWINAFIPDTLSGAFRASAGPFAGRQVFKSLPVPSYQFPFFQFNSCFETDERGFSSSLPLSSRLHVEAEFDTLARMLIHSAGLSGGLSGGSTFEINCTTGNVICTSSVTPRGSGVTLISPMVPFSSRFDLLVEAFANDRCVPGSPDIAIRGLIGIDIGRRTFDFGIFTTLFPALEMYMSVSGGTPKTLWTQPCTSSVLFLVPPGVVPHTGSGSF